MPLGRLELLASVVLLGVALLACKQSAKPGACEQDTDCAAGTTCVGGTCTLVAAPPPPVVEEPAPVVTAAPVAAKQCALIAISISGPAGNASIGRECDVEVVDDGETLKSDCSMASHFTPKGGGAARQLKGGRFSFSLKQREAGSMKYSGTATESGATNTVFLTFTNKYDTANGQFNAGANRYTLTFRPCKKK